MYVTVKNLRLIVQDAGGSNCLNFTNLLKGSEMCVLLKE